MNDDHDQEPAVLDTVTLDDGTTVTTYEPDDAPDPDAYLYEPLADVRRYVDPDDDPEQLDRIEAKLDSIRAGADAMREATEPMLAAMSGGPGGLMSMLGGMLR